MLPELRAGCVYQLPLPVIGADVQTYREGRIEYYPEVQIGSPVIDIVCAIVTHNLEITHIGVIRYDLSKNSEKFSPNQPEDIVWMESGPDLQGQLVDFNELTVQSDSGRGIAICSCVKLSDGTLAHIPMMNCASENDIDKEDTHAWLIENGMRGYLVQTDKSFHYWGLNLMTDTQYVQFMRKCRENIMPLDENGEALIGWPIFCEGFINASSQANFAALRIFGYEDENKSITPFVIDTV